MIHRELEQSNRVVERSAGAEIEKMLAGFHDSRRTLLMARHANIIGKPARELRRVDNCVIHIPGQGRPMQARFHVELARSVAVFTSNPQLCKGRILIEALMA